MLASLLHFFAQQCNKSRRKTLAIKREGFVIPTDKPLSSLSCNNTIVSHQPHLLIRKTGMR